MEPPTPQDQRHVELLSIFHYVLGGLSLLMGFFPIIHLTVGIAALTGRMDGAEPPPPMFGWVFVVVGGGMMLFMWAVGVLQIVAGAKLRKRTSIWYCMVIGGIECAFMPLGTILGVFTLIVLSRERVRALFEGAAVTAPQAPPPVS